MMTTPKMVGVMQPYLFPYLGYFALLKCVDEYVILDNVQMIKRGWINRNNILLSGKPHRFTISLTNSSQSRMISDVCIGDDFKAFRKLLVSSYAKAPHFDPVIKVVDEIIQCKKRSLSLFIENSLTVLMRYLNINTRLTRASDMPINSELTGQSRILALSKAMGAGRYINAAGGMELYAQSEFEAQGVDLKFLRFFPQPYHQGVTEFVPNLSILDAIMYASPTEVSTLLDSYELVNADQAARTDDRTASVQHPLCTSS